jgi:hypothetical protein
MLLDLGVDLSSLATIFCIYFGVLLAKINKPALFQLGYMQCIWRAWPQVDRTRRLS